MKKYKTTPKEKTIIKLMEMVIRYSYQHCEDLSDPEFAMYEKVMKDAVDKEVYIYPLYDK